MCDRYNKIIVLGLGNPLMGDEGIGTTIIEMLADIAGSYPEVDFVDAGTGGMNVLHLIGGRKKALIIDCAFMNERPGTIRRFAPDEVRSAKKLAHQSLHEADIIKVVELSRQLTETPREVVFFGIEPETIEQKMELSDTLKKKLNEYMEIITAELV